MSPSERRHLRDVSAPAPAPPGLPEPPVNGQPAAGESDPRSRHPSAHRLRGAQALTVVTGPTDPGAGRASRQANVPQEYVATDLPNGGISLHVGPVVRAGPHELQPVEHVGVRVRSDNLAAGYRGTGPLDTALSILVHALGEQEMWTGDRCEVAPPSTAKSQARELHQRFMREVVSKMPQRGGWTLPRRAVANWVHRTLADPRLAGADPLGR